MTDLPRNFVLTVVRRSLFIAALLVTGPMAAFAFHYCQQANAPGLQPLAVFAWGLDSIETVLAVWLTARAGIWHSWQGQLRVACYIVAFTYGRMMFTATQNWLRSSDANFRLPGMEQSDFALPSMLLLTLLLYTWLLTPMVIFTSAVLSCSKGSMKRSSRFSITDLFGFTTMAAIALVWTSFLTSNLAPRTYYSHLSQSDALKELLGIQLPLTVPPLIASMVILYGFTMRWWLTLLAFAGAFALDVLGTTIVATVAELITGGQPSHVLRGFHIDRWVFICGRSSTVYCAFLAATAFGVRPKFCND